MSRVARIWMKWKLKSMLVEMTDDQLMREHRGDQQQFAQTILTVVNETNKSNKDLAVVLDRVAIALHDTENELRLARSQREQA